MCAELEKTGVIGDNGVGIPILTGETGVGKTTAVEGLVQRIVRGAVDRRDASAGSGRVMAARALVRGCPR